MSWPLYVALAAWGVLFLSRLSAMVAERRHLGPTTFELCGETFSGEDWRVEGRKSGRTLISYCVTKGEAEETRNYMKGAGYRGVRIERIA